MTSPMRFGLPGSRGSLAPGSAVATLDLARRAEALGFDALWLSEEHFSVASATVRRRQPSALMVAAALAANTSRIRIGFTVLLPQLHDAHRLAEDIATLDILSGGRINLGLGWPNPAYLKAFSRGSDQPELAEQLAIMIDDWSGRPIVLDGTAYVVEPPPLQQPHPPIYIAPGDQDALDWAAARGHAVILSAFQSRTSLHETLTRFGEAGGRIADSPIERFCFVGESDEAARHHAWPLVVAMMDRFAQTGATQMANRIIPESDLDPERFYNEVALIGSPATVAARIAALRADYGVQCINLRPSFWGSCPANLQALTVERFARDVAPKLA
jgi:alkanesulfonate monooxygenase SsuD/methylene tetrahydromethanopterin reductase-like flavin-dependent oxidoreductase (luciferase family)